jgi:hypothetical protein
MRYDSTSINAEHEDNGAGEKAGEPSSLAYVDGEMSYSLWWNGLKLIIIKHYLIWLIVREDKHNKLSR